jgi:type IV secretion system protein VirB3
VEGEAPEIQDVCFLALTRPVMFQGVPLEAFGFNVMGSMLCGLTLGTMLYASIGIIIHYVFRALVRRDHNMFRVLVAWLNTRGVQRNRTYWGGSSVSPMRVSVAYSGSDHHG